MGGTPGGGSCRGARLPLAPFPPSEAGRRRLWRERAGREAVGRIGHVVAARRDVVGRGGMEERGEVLDLAAAGADLELPAAVHADVALGAVVVGTHQLAQ